ncbi:AI-2E family transporter [Cryobacterium sp. TMT2-17-1]|uniref:AI-2E family transporter n=1 Tax=Cryobacterium sp. TMT2-17-1 TaxID=1259248 RepID=UPI001069EC01|nr:AI-2E family transporter [Cryobacterium sp. TMT2-17-1]TFC47678.1 AI-2E family transporter [Cryobacterium sp. TMT2-17-1]
MRAEDPSSPSLQTLLTSRLGRWAIRSTQIVVVVVLTAGAVYALVQVQLVVIPVLVALILASALAPLVGWLRTRGLPVILATWITLLAGALILGGIVTLIVFAVRNQWGALVVAAGDGLDELQGLLVEGPIALDSEQFNAVRDAIVGFVTPTVLGQYVRGTAIIALFDAVLIGVGLAILQVPLALPLAVIVFLTAFIPLIGATVAGILAALVALVANGPLVALIVVAIVIVVNQIEGDLLNPVVMAGALKLHPLVILVALTVGTILGGIAGAVLAVPLVAVGWAMIKVWDRPDQSITQRAKFSIRHRPQPAKPAEAAPLSARGGEPTIGGI